MALVNNISRTNRRLAFFISIVALLVAFFIGFYYYYVPSNKENVNKYAFLILDDIKTSVTSKIENLNSLYGSNVISNNWNIDVLSKKIDSQRLDGKVLNSVS